MSKTIDIYGGPKKYVDILLKSVFSPVGTTSM